MTPPAPAAPPRAAPGRSPPPPGRLRRRLLLLGYMVTMFALSHMSRPPLPESLLRLGDKVLHGAEYALLAWLWSRAVGGSWRRRALLAWLGATAFGLTDELHQAFVPGRTSSALDLVADTLGAAAGAALGALRRPSGSRPEPDPKLFSPPP
ncbi:MAG: VanZ family protein [Deferrisomatales bacterium]